MEVVKHVLKPTIVHIMKKIREFRSKVFTIYNTYVKSLEDYSSDTYVSLDVLLEKLKIDKRYIMLFVGYLG